MSSSPELGSLTALSTEGIAGRVALVTGSTSGIGKAVAAHLHRSGAAVVINARNQQGIDETLSEFSDPSQALLIGHAADVTDPEQVQAMVQRISEEIGSIDILVNNVGTTHVAPALETDAETWRRIIDINLTSSFLCSKAVAPGMMAAGGGTIVNISSILGQIAMANRSVYVAAKHGLDGLTKALAVEWGPDGIRVVTVNPGFTRTPLMERNVERGLVRLSDIERHTPTGRVGTQEEVAALVAFVVSPAARQINGAHYVIDGGWMANGGI